MTTNLILYENMILSLQTCIFPQCVEIQVMLGFHIVNTMYLEGGNAGHVQRFHLLLKCVVECGDMEGIHCLMSKYIHDSQFSY